MILAVFWMLVSFFVNIIKGKCYGKLLQQFYSQKVKFYGSLVKI